MKLLKANVVAIGQFNPAIIVPGWLKAQGILQADEAQEEHAVGATALAHRYQMQGYVWTVSLERLIFERLCETPEDASRPASVVSDILGRLSHTPLRAVGINFEFEDAAQHEPAIDCKIEGRAVADLARELGYTLASTHVQATLEDDRQVQIQLSAHGRPGTKIRTLNFNFQRLVSSTEQAQQALTQVREDLRRAELAGQAVFGIRP